MFYVKETIGESMEVVVEINEGNVYCRCPRCGAEMHVDLSKLAGDKEFDLYGTSLYCAECSRKVRCDK